MFTFEQTRSFFFTKERHFQSSDFKMFQLGGFTESEEVNRINKRQEDRAEVN